MRAYATIAGLLAASLAVSCTSPAGEPDGGPAGITPEKHVWFPITAGTNHALMRTLIDGTTETCESCHALTNASYEQFDCVGCHEHDKDITDPLHLNVPDYRYAAEGCYACHPTGERMAFSHFGVDSSCASCHDVGKVFAALPLPGFTHPSMGNSDCGACHVKTTWKGAGNAPLDSHDPTTDLTLDGLIPTWSGTTITSLNVRTQTLINKMNHASTQLPAAALSPCTNCHADAPQGSFYPGVLHASLEALSLAPTGCSDCHDSTVPEGFVGPVASSPARTPPSGEMRHDAVAWTGGAPGTTALVSKDCKLCHVAPTAALPAKWDSDKTTGGRPVRYHASLGAGQQPSECLDCHANTRPASLLTLAGGLSFNHQLTQALGECKTCHDTPAALAGQSWAQGKFHATNPAPSTCLPCHDAERPVSTSAWASTTFTRSPFDYVTNTRGITHGAGQDCVVCHSRTQDWTGGSFSHAPTSIAATQCVSCHTTQRPDLLPGATAASMATLLGFDHSVNGSGDCFGCHQATVAGGRYVDLYQPGAAMTPANLRGGDWDGGVGYPGSFVSSNDQSITITQTTLNRSGPNNLVTSMTSVMTTLYNGMLHTSTVLPAGLSPGPVSNPDNTTCWHCHTSSNMMVTSFSNGQFHSALTDAGFPQPTNQCLDCHATMLPQKIVQKGTTNLQPMDHLSQFTGTVNIGGAMVNRVSQLDCSTCHSNPGVSWSDGVFHARIGAAVPADCNGGCHYPLLADAARSDLTSGTTYKMMHRSLQITFQACERCHAGALARAATTPLAATLWRNAAGPATYHPNLTTAQPTACVDCHTVSLPPATLAGSVVYAPVNQPQWMNHASPVLAGKDCAVCHASDAKLTGSAWNHASKVHGPLPSVTTCRECHGLTNGKGTVPGTNNNMPAGLRDTATVTTASAATGVPAGTKDQISHADVNVTTKDCNLCHTQQGQSTAAGVQGREWAVAKFHVSFTGANGLVLDGAGGRCSNCHLNVKPTASFTAFDHGAFTAAPGTEDCSSCHSWPGTGTATAPNWRGASGAPAIVTLRPWTSGTSITSKTITFAHPPATTYTSCAQCHLGVDYTKVIDFNHAGLSSNVTIDGATPAAQPNLGSSVYNASTNPTFCVHCHNTGSPYVATAPPAPFIANTTMGSTTVTTSSTAALTIGMTITGTGIPSTTTTTTMLVANTTAGSVTVTTATPVSLSAGTAISGPGIPANDTVATSVANATSFNLRVAATATASGVTLTAVRTTPLTVTLRTIPSSTSFTVSTAANATLTGTTLSVTHKRINQERIGSHENSVSGQDCTSCHARGGTQNLSLPTAGVFGGGAF